MPELAKRVLFALVAAPVFLGFMWLGGWFFYGLMALIGVLVHRELFNLVAAQQPEASYTLSLIFLIWILTIQFNPFFVQSGLLIFCLLIAAETLRSSPDLFKNLSNSLFAALYSGITIVSIAFIRSYYDFTGLPGITPETAGFAITLLFVLLVWGNDVFAYFGGTLFGKHALAPAISPKKTWEGFYAGFLGGFAALGITYGIFADVMPDIKLAIPIVIMICIFAPIGDLAQSKIKRSAKIKDSSNILPGHGGFFDRFDAMMLAAPVYLVYVYMYF